jgi:hypothetical protein
LAQRQKQLGNCKERKIDMPFAKTQKRNQQKEERKRVKMEKLEFFKNKQMDLKNQMKRMLKKAKIKRNQMKNQTKLKETKHQQTKQQTKLKTELKRNQLTKKLQFSKRNQLKKKL